MKYITLILLGALLSGTYAMGDTKTAPAAPPPPLPPGTLVNHASGYSQWQIHFSYVAPEKEKVKEKPKSKLKDKDKKDNVFPPTPAPIAKQIPVDPSVQMPPQDVYVTFTKPLWHAVLIDTAGRKTETWYDGTTTYLIPFGDPHPNPVGADETDLLPPLLSYGKRDPDFPDIDWLKPEMYTGVKLINGIKCFVFQNTLGGATVWINSATRFPVRWQKGNEIRDFTFMSPPVTALTLPDDVMAISKAMSVVRQNNGPKLIRGL